MALLLPALAACAEAGQPWLHLSEAQRAELSAWKMAVRRHAAEVLQGHGIRLNGPGDPRHVPPGEGAVAVELLLVVDRRGEILRGEASQASAAPGAARRFLDWIVEAGRVPAPPPSLVTFGETPRVSLAFRARLPPRPPFPRA